MDPDIFMSAARCAIPIKKGASRHIGYSPLGYTQRIVQKDTDIKKNISSGVLARTIAVLSQVTPLRQLSVGSIQVYVSKTSGFPTAGRGNNNPHTQRKRTERTARLGGRLTWGQR